MTVPHHSTYVELRLIVDDREFALSHVGRDFIVFREPVDLPKCTAILSMMVDGSDRRERVCLVNGAVPFDTRVEIASVN